MTDKLKPEGGDCKMSATEAPAVEKKKFEIII
jgi:hypothetical protein